MGKDIKFGYFYNLNGFNINLREFEKSFLKEEGKFIQIRINEEDYIRVGHLYHRRLLKETLDEFGLKFYNVRSAIGNLVPPANGENHKLVGAGKISLYGEKLNFYDASSDYFYYVKGTDRESLERMFGEEKVTEVEGYNEPSFLVRV